MSRAIESIRRARERVNPDNLATSLTIAATSHAAVIPIQAGIAYSIHELGSEVSPDIHRIFVIGMIALVNTISVAIETKTLNEKKFSASPISSSLNMATDKPLIASLGSHLINNAQLSVISPISVAAVFTGNDELLIASAGATSVTIGLWRTTMNSLIMHGKVDPVVRSFSRIREFAVRKFKKSK